MNQTIGESQRDSVSKPRVARNELPWDQRASEIQPQRGCGFWRTAAGHILRSGSSSHCIRQRGRRLSIYLVWTAVLANTNLLAASPAEYSATPYAGDDLFADTWVATDGAGRK